MLIITTISTEMTNMNENIQNRVDEDQINRMNVDVRVERDGEMREERVDDGIRNDRVERVERVNTIIETNRNNNIKDRYTYDIKIIDEIKSDYVELCVNTVSLLRFHFMDAYTTNNFIRYAFHFIQPGTRRDVEIYRLKFNVIRDRIGRLIDSLGKNNNKHRFQNIMDVNSSEMSDVN